MALYCITCRTVAKDGDAVCRNCGNGFVSRLACGTCQRVVPSGRAFCSSCPSDSNRARDRDGGALMPALSLPSLSLPTLPPGLTPERAYVPEVYEAGRFGARAVVQMNGKDADIMTKMNQVAMLLHALAAEMNDFQGVADSTRRLIKGCRNLATELQEEVEVRRGPER